MKHVLFFVCALGLVSLALVTTSTSEVEAHPGADAAQIVAEAGPDVTAHPGPNVRRTKAACKGLKKPGKHAACLVCVKRPKPHHFHPLKAPDKRCRPNNGKP